MLRNISESTRQLINSMDRAKYVSTYAERSAHRCLCHLGSIFIQGRSGSGKTRMGYRLLETVSEETKRIPILLTSAKLLKHIPRKGKEKYVIMVDDIFGSSNMVEARVAEWTRHFEILLPAVECGHILLLFVSRRDIVVPNLHKFQLLRMMRVIDLDSEEYSLRRSERIKLVKKSCQRISSIAQIDIEDIAKVETKLGFPQCCAFFANNKTLHERGVQFFSKPYEFIESNVNELKENDLLGYYVLLLIMWMDNNFDNKLLLKPTAEFNVIRETLRDICTDFSTPPSCRQIRDKVISLTGVYLSRTEYCLTFQHQTIFDAVFVNAVKDNQDRFLSRCPVHILLEFVSLNPKTDSASIYVEKKSYDVLAKRVTEIILSDDCWSILSHPAFQNQAFIDVLSGMWSKTTLRKISSHKAHPEDMVFNTCNKKIFDMVSIYFFEIGSHFQDEEVIFSVRHALSFFLMKKIWKLFQITLSYVDDVKILQETMQCALFLQHYEFVEQLLCKNVPYNEIFIKVMCCIKDTDIRIVERMFSLLEGTGQPLQDPGRLLSLAVKHGNIHIMKKLITKLKEVGDSDKLLIRCLQQLLFQCTTSLSPHMTAVSSTAIPVVDMMKLFVIPSKPNISHDLLRCAASHDSSSALEYLLNICLPKTDFSVPDIVLEDAAKYGTAHSLSLLLQYHSRCSNLLLITASMSFQQSQEKVELLLNKLCILHENCDPEESAARKQKLVNTQDKCNNTSLHFAALRRDASCVRTLLKARADATIRNSDDLTPLHCSVIAGSVECLSELLKSHSTKCKSNTIIPKMSPLLWYDWESFSAFQNFKYKIPSLSVLEKTRKDVMDVLLSTFVNINDVDLDGRTCIFTAAVHRDLHFLSFLLSKGSELDVRDFCGRTALHEAVKHADVDIVMYLCERGSKVDVEDNNGVTMVHEAAGAEDDALEKLKFLIDVRSAPIKCDNDDRNALFNASKNDDIEVLEYLVSKGVMINVTDRAGVNLLHESCKYGSSCFVNYLLKNGTLDVNSKTKTGVSNRLGNTALHFAVQASTLGKSTMVELLLKHGADVLAKDDHGRTPLHLLVTRPASHKFGKCDNKAKIREYIDARRRKRNEIEIEDLKTIKLLLDKGADVHDRDESGNAALHWALKSVLAWKRVKILLDSGAKINQKGGHRRTPLHCAAKIHEHMCLKSLIMNGSDVNALDDDGRTPLHIAAELGHSMIVGLLIKHGSNVQIQDNKGNTALHLTVLSSPRNVVSVMKLLLEAGADKTILNQDGKRVIDLTGEQKIQMLL